MPSKGASWVASVAMLVSTLSAQSNPVHEQPPDRSRMFRSEAPTQAQTPSYCPNVRKTNAPTEVAAPSGCLRATKARLCGITKLSET
jgi:hypothetical protein